MKYKIAVTPPSDEDWKRCFKYALRTMSKSSDDRMPSDAWKLKTLHAGHSMARELWFEITMEIPSWVSVHYTRHSIGVNHYVSTQRNDRQDNYDRHEAPQSSSVVHTMRVNAVALAHIAHVRLCQQASKETRQVMEQIKALVEGCGEYYQDWLQPKCVFQGNRCFEFKPCGRMSYHD